ncbi:helix-turn-helix domain-containing protein, partial [Bordetella bronchiseptica]
MQRLRFDLVTLRLFVAVYEERSLSKAAEREFIAPSALSKRITDMEQMLNRELFIRNHRGIEPTPLA